MLRDSPPEHVEAERRTVLIGRFLDPAEIAATVAFLVGPGGDGYVGQVLSPNGGTVFPG
jgi:NAD(P)-dependent dehydrogenase (short-subunit alcohol dehydrogenase family)